MNTTTERFLNGFAAVITIATFFFSLFSSQVLDLQQGAVAIRSMDVAGRLLIFLVLQTCLAYAFGFPLSNTDYFELPSRIVAQVTLLGASAWLSLFNVIGILFAGIPSDRNSVGLAFCIYMFAAMFAGWIWNTTGNIFRKNHRRIDLIPLQRHPFGPILAHLAMFGAFWTAVVWRADMFAP